MKPEDPPEVYIPWEGSDGHRIYLSHQVCATGKSTSATKEFCGSYSLQARTHVRSDHIVWLIDSNGDDGPSPPKQR